MGNTKSSKLILSINKPGEVAFLHTYECAQLTPLGKPRKKGKEPRTNKKIIMLPYQSNYDIKASLGYWSMAFEKYSSFRDNTFQR